jgi:hypothetical protein
VQLHVVERIADIGISQLIQPHRERIVWRNCNQGHALLAIIFVELHNPFFVCLGCRAVVASKNDDEQFRVGEIIQAIGLVIDARQIELRGRRTDF